MLRFVVSVVVSVVGLLVVSCLVPAAGCAQEPEPVWTLQPNGELIEEPASSPPNGSGRASASPHLNDITWSKLQLGYAMTGERYSYGGWSAAAFLIPYILVPIVHGVHGNLGIGILSVVGFYASLIGGLYVGAEMSNRSNSGGHAVVPPEMFLGALLGAIGWIIFDANVLAYDYRPRPGRRLPTFYPTAGAQP